MNKRDNQELINIDKLKSKKVVDKITKPIIYSPEDYGISSRYTGLGTKMLIIDSGKPRHKDIHTEGERHDFTAPEEENENVFDEDGHGTIVSGIIASRKKSSIIGIAPDTQISYAKVTDKKGNSSYSAVVSAVLWGIVKKVDIIVIALGSQYDYHILHDAIKKASDNGICIFAAAGNHINEENSEVNFPARYPEVFSVGNLTRTKKVNEKILEKVDFAMKNKVTTSTYLKNKYINTSGSSVSTAFVAGLASLIMEKLREEKKRNMKKYIYSELQKIVK
jgi:subtilisin family serine protease